MENAVINAYGIPEFRIKNLNALHVVKCKIAKWVCPPS